MTGDTEALRILRGNPTPEEVAVLTVALLALSHNTVQPPADEAPGRPRWPRGADPVPAAAGWAGGARPGWGSP